MRRDSMASENRPDQWYRAHSACTHLLLNGLLCAVLSSELEVGCPPPALPEPFSVAKITAMVGMHQFGFPPVNVHGPVNYLPSDQE